MKPRTKECNKINRVLRITLALILITILTVSAIQIYKITGEYNRAEAIREDMQIYKPEYTPATGSPNNMQHNPGTGDGTKTDAINQTVIDAQNNVNDDIVGWLTIPNTKVDYLFVQAENNEFYLHKDLNKKQAAAGSVFMDSANSKNFTDFNTIIYGHHMKNGSMFQSLKSFADSKFFTENQTGMLFLPHNTYTLRIFAYMIVNAGDTTIYNISPDPETVVDGYFDYVRKNAKQFRELDFTGEDKVVTLSSCSYEYGDARMVLLARLEESHGY
jgi:sortase B